jgi:hypothetical protein
MRGKDWVPSKELELLTLMKKWDEILSNATKRTAFGWEAEPCARVILDIGTFQNAQEDYVRNNSKTNRIIKDRTRKVAVSSMRHFARASIRFNDKMMEEDKGYMGVYGQDATYTPKPDPIDLVRFKLTTIPSDHRVIAHFSIENSESRGKGPYHAAEIRFWVRPLDAPAPDDPDEDGGHSEASTRSPWEKTFPGSDKGKNLHIKMRWENESTGPKGKGPWSATESIIIP